MSITIIVRNRPLARSIRLSPPPGRQKGRGKSTVVFPGFTAMEPAEQREVLDWASHATGRKITEDEAHAALEPKTRPHITTDPDRKTAVLTTETGEKLETPLEK